MKNYSQSTKTKFALRETASASRKTVPATVKYLAFITLIGLFAPFSHIFWLNSEQEGFFGFQLMSSFLFAIGFPLTSVCFGLIIKFFSDDLKTFKKAGYIISNLFVFVGFYFIAWAIWPQQDLPAELYSAALITIAVLVTILVDYLSKLAPNTQKLKNTIRYLLDVIVLKARTQGHIKDEKQYVKDIIEPAIDFVNEVATNHRVKEEV